MKGSHAHEDARRADRFPTDSFGGTGASGNGGRFGGTANLEEFMRWQWVAERDEPATYPF